MESVCKTCQLAGRCIFSEYSNNMNYCSYWVQKEEASKLEELEISDNIVLGEE